MSVAKIALGVFLGNLMFGVLAWLVMGAWLSHTQAAVVGAETDAAYNAMQARRAADGNKLP
jgi:hypothetical protein